MIRPFLILLAALAAACSPKPEPVAAAPALWEVTGPEGQRGWLFGTIHALPDGIGWRRPAIDNALKSADVLVTEVDDLDPAKVTPIFERLMTTKGLPGLRERVGPEHQAALDRALAEARATDGQFRNIEDWAAVIILSQMIAQRQGMDSGNGVDVALLKEARAAGKPIVGLETAEGQLSKFDRLPAPAQHAMLIEAIAEATDGDALIDQLQAAWAKGDEAALTKLANDDLADEPALRESLLVGRNRDWAVQLEAMLKGGRHPFVAVGAGHLVGPDSVPQMLAARGFTVRRLP